MRLSSNERTLLVGATGTGKTYLAQRLVASAPRLVVIDPKSTLRGQWGLSEYERVRRKVTRGEPVRARFAPEPGGEAGYERVLEDVYHAGNTLVYIDEVYGVVPPGRPAGPYFTALYTRGREMGIGVIAATQRPAWVPLFIASEAQNFIMFALLFARDKKRMAEFMGDAVLADIPDPHGFFFYQTRWRGVGGGARYYRSVR